MKVDYYTTSCLAGLSLKGMLVVAAGLSFCIEKTLVDIEFANLCSTSSGGEGLGEGGGVSIFLPRGLCINGNSLTDLLESTSVEPFSFHYRLFLC